MLLISQISNIILMASASMLGSHPTFRGNIHGCGKRLAKIGTRSSAGLRRAKSARGQGSPLICSRRPSNPWKLMDQEVYIKNMSQESKMRTRQSAWMSPCTRILSLHKPAQAQEPAAFPATSCMTSLKLVTKNYPTGRVTLSRAHAWETTTMKRQTCQGSSDKYRWTQRIHADTTIRSTPLLGGLPRTSAEGYPPPLWTWISTKRYE